MPARAVCGKVFVHVPEARVIRGIDAEVAVIAPARAVRLRTRTIEHMRFALAKVAGWITSQTPSITNTGVDGAARDRIPNSRVARVINRDARHESIQTITSIGPRLLLHWRSGEITAGHIKLVPTNTCWLGAVCVLTNGAIRPQGLCPALVEIDHRRHDSIAQSLDSIGSAQLRHNRKTGRSRECINEWIDSDQRIRSVVCTGAKG